MCEFMKEKKNIFTERVSERVMERQGVERLSQENRTGYIKSFEENDYRSMDEEDLEVYIQHSEIEAKNRNINRSTLKGIEGESAPNQVYQDEVSRASHRYAKTRKRKVTTSATLVAKSRQMAINMKNTVKTARAPERIAAYEELFKNERASDRYMAEGMSNTAEEEAALKDKADRSYYTKLLDLYSRELNGMGANGGSPATFAERNALDEATKNAATQKLSQVQTKLVDILKKENVPLSQNKPDIDATNANEIRAYIGLSQLVKKYHDTDKKISTREFNKLFMLGEGSDDAVFATIKNVYEKNFAHLGVDFSDFFFLQLNRLTGKEIEDLQEEYKADALVAYKDMAIEARVQRQGPSVSDYFTKRNRKVAMTRNLLVEISTSPFKMTQWPERFTMPTESNDPVEKLKNLEAMVRETMSIHLDSQMTTRDWILENFDKIEKIRRFADRLTDMLAFSQDSVYEKYARELKANDPGFFGVFEKKLSLINTLFKHNDGMDPQEFEKQQGEYKEALSDYLKPDAQELERQASAPTDEFYGEDVKAKKQHHIYKMRHRYHDFYIPKEAQDAHKSVLGLNTYSQEFLNRTFQSALKYVELDEENNPLPGYELDHQFNLRLVEAYTSPDSMENRLKRKEVIEEMIKEYLALNDVLKNFTDPNFIIENKELYTRYNRLDVALKNNILGIEPEDRRGVSEVVEKINNDVYNSLVDKELKKAYENTWKNDAATAMSIYVKNNLIAKTGYDMEAMNKTFRVMDETTKAGSAALADVFKGVAVQAGGDDYFPGEDLSKYKQ